MLHCLNVYFIEDTSSAAFFLIWVFSGRVANSLGRLFFLSELTPVSRARGAQLNKHGNNNYI